MNGNEQQQLQSPDPPSEDPKELPEEPSGVPDQPSEAPGVPSDEVDGSARGSDNQMEDEAMPEITAEPIQEPPRQPVVEFHDPTVKKPILAKRQGWVQ